MILRGASPFLRGKITFLRCFRYTTSIFHFITHLLNISRIKLILTFARASDLKFVYVDIESYGEEIKILSAKI